jgi:ubiquinone/menaquinone biosynthesis C-methylase UbiE
LTDEIARYQIARWRALVAADALYTRMRLDQTPESARQTLDPEGWFGDVTGKRVLCLASGGGHQSVGFALLGAEVVVFDLSAEQLERDRAAAAHYGVTIETIAGDMRDLSPLATDSFDYVYHPYSLNFVPDTRAVFREVARVLRAGGHYYLACANPFVFGLSERDWTGAGYLLTRPYVDGAELTNADPEYVYDRAQHAPVPAPREFRHTLSTLVRGLFACGFVLEDLADDTSIQPDPQAAPGTWNHLVAIAPPWLAFWCCLRPDVSARAG